MLGAEPSILRRYVADGELRIIFWDNLDSSERATYLHEVAHCAGEQDPAYFWRMHDYLFQNQMNLVNMDNEQLSSIVEKFGAERDTFEACLADDSGRMAVEALEAIAEERGIRSRPIFDINGAQMFGAQPFPAFSAIIDEALQQ